MHPAVQRALEISARLFPEPTSRARVSLNTLLQASVEDAASQPRAWSFSYLAKGFPVEWVCTSRQHGVRYTVDTAGVGRRPQEVLPYSAALLEEIAGVHCAKTTMTFLQSIQQHGPLKYGCWIGGRHTADRDEFKLYVEVPPGADADAIAWLGQHTPLQVDFYERPISRYCRLTLDIIGYAPLSEHMEYYFSVRGLAAWEIGALLTPAGLASARQPLIDLLQEAYGRPIYRDFPSGQMGFSYAWSPATAQTVFSLYTFAAAMFGGDARVRQEILALSARHGWDMTHYAQLSQPLACAPRTQRTHGLFGIALAEGQAPAISLGLRPPDVS